MAEMPAEKSPHSDLAALALDCVHKEFPNAILHTLESERDVARPRDLHPAFFGCFDWHSSVHGHWLLARLARLYPHAEYAPAARAALGQSLTPANIAGEMAYVQSRPAFERPYGMAWLLQLAGELNEWARDRGELVVVAEVANWQTALKPLESHAAGVFLSWLPKLATPIRAGTHAQSAFALGLARDWADITRHSELLTLIDERSRHFHAKDVNCPVAFEPSAHDFLSPCLAEADLMRRVLAPAEFVRWFDGFLPDSPAMTRWLQPATVSDPTDGHIVHLDGLNLSRAWMLRNVARCLPPTHPMRERLLTAGSAHATSGLTSVRNPHYAGGHWLGTFAAYLLTDRGWFEP